MKSFIAITCLLLWAGCAHKGVPTTSAFFEISNATKTPWAAGVLGGGTGTDYNVFINLKKDLKPKVDSMWVDGQRIEAMFSPMKGNLAEIRATLMDPRADYTPEYAAPPLSHKGEVLIRYMIQGKTYWISVSNFSKLNRVNLP